MPEYPFDLGAVEHSVIETIATTLAARTGRLDKGDVLTSNVGGAYDGEKFSLRAYCWCEGDGMRTLGGGYIHHEDGCPPNFEHHRSGLQVEWYKHAGRGAYMNKRLTPDELLAVTIDCLNEIATTDVDLLRLRLGDED